jgi:hypothetical protein
MRPDEWRIVDELRGPLSRSEWLRRQVQAAGGMRLGRGKRGSA